MELPSYEKDHYVLDNGEEVHREFPDSFLIPELSKRESLKPGDIVKLIFRMEQTKGSDDISVERMWVNVTEVNVPFYKGTLDNEPMHTDCIVCGQVVTFNPCHVIAIYEG